LRYPPLAHAQSCADLDFSPDGKLLLSASYDHTARLWDVDTGKQHGPSLEHSDWVYQARFSPDGRQILTASRDRTACLWDAATGHLIGAPLEHGAEVFSAAFSPEGRWIYTATNAWQWQVWDRRSGKPVSPAFALGDSVHTVNAALNGERLAASCDRSFTVLATGRLLAASPPGTDVNAVSRWAELVSMKRFVAGGMTDLTPAEWLDRWHAYRAGQGAIGANVR
jgi:WD40 repeat protein